MNLTKAQKQVLKELGEGKVISKRSFTDPWALDGSKLSRKDVDALWNAGVIGFKYELVLTDKGRALLEEK